MSSSCDQAPVCPFQAHVFACMRHACVCESMHVPKDVLPGARAALAHVGEAAGVPGSRVWESRRASVGTRHLHGARCCASVDAPTAAPASPARE